jgi:ATP synthase (E/31 kDa) subunit
MHDQVSIRCRTEDVSIVKQSLLKASAEYQEMTLKEVKVSIDEARPIPTDQCVLLAHTKI